MNKMISVEEYVKQQLGSVYQNLCDEYKRLTTPSYYETGVNYLTTDEKSNYREYTIIEADYLKDGDLLLYFKSTSDNNFANGYGFRTMKLSEAHKSMKRVDETILPKGNHIPNSRKFLYIKHNDIEYTIEQWYSRNWSNKKLDGKIIITSPSFKTFPSTSWLANKHEYYELYSVIGRGSWNLNHVYGYDGANRELHTLKFGVSIREFKEIVFGDPDIKFKCQLFGDK